MSASVDVVQFVDRIDGAPTVRLDLNDDITWSLSYSGTDFSPPALKTAWANTLLADGEQLTASAYGNRTIRLSLDLKTASMDAGATQLQALWRELNRPTNFLKWQPQGITRPVFFRTMRSSDNRVTDYPGDGTLRTVQVEIVAEPFAIGVKQTLPDAEVSHNPAAVTNGLYFDLSGVQGDVETPLLMQMSRQSVLSSVGSLRYSYVAVRRRGTPSGAPFLLQCEAMDHPDSDTTNQANDPAMSGTGQNWARSTMAGVLLFAKHMIINWPAVASVDVRGTYRVLLRYRCTGSTQVWLRWGSSALTGNRPWTDNPRVDLIPDGSLHYVDLGLASMPYGPDPVVDSYSGVELAVAHGAILIFAERLAASGVADWDHLLFVPADDRLAIINWQCDDGGTDPLAPKPNAVTVDGTRDTIYWGNAGQVWSRPPSQISGGLPMVSPGAVNRIYWIPSVGIGTTAGGAISGVTGSTTISPSYYPRYLSVAPAAS